MDVHDRSVDRQAVPDSRGDESRIPAGGAQCVQPSGVCDSSHLGERRQLWEDYWDGGWTARDAAGIQVQLLKAVVGRSSFVNGKITMPHFSQESGAFSFENS